MIIGITGKKFSGKDTLADIICEKYGYKKYSFADPLKDISRILFNFTDEQLYGTEKEIVDDYWNITPREVYQYLGTEIFRNKINDLIPNINEDFWIKHMEKKILDSDFKIVIPDVRFENERNLIKEYGGKIIKIERDIPLNNLSNHESECNDIEYDYRIQNNGSIDKLSNSLKKLINKNNNN